MWPQYTEDTNFASVLSKDDDISDGNVGSIIGMRIGQWKCLRWNQNLFRWLIVIRGAEGRGQVVITTRT